MNDWFKQVSKCHTFHFVFSIHRAQLQPGVSKEVFRGFPLLRNLLKILMFQVSHWGKHSCGHHHALPSLSPAALVKVVQSVTLVFGTDLLQEFRCVDTKFILNPAALERDASLCSGQ